MICVEKVDLDLAISRLLLGYQIVYLDDLEIKVVNPDISLIHEANLLVKNLYIKNKYTAYSKGMLEKIFIKKGVIDADYKVKIDKMYKGLDDLKLDLYNSAFKVEQAKRIRNQIRIHRENMSKYISGVDGLFYYSIENGIDRSKLYYIYIKTALHNDSPLFDADKVDFSLLNDLLAEIDKNSLTSSDLRYIARSSEWRSYWLLSKQDSFNCSVANLSDDQRLLCSFSMMYDNALECSDFPQYVMNDDDLFDGWKLFKHKEHEDSLKENKANKPAGKHYQTRYIAAESQEEANNIYNLNSSRAKNKIHNRAAELTAKKEVRIFQDELIGK